MPNPKLGTVTMDVAEAVKRARMGQVEFRADKFGIVHLPLGKVSFSDTALLGNMKAAMIAVNAAKPDGAKGQFLRSATLSSAQGPGMRLDMKTLDPASPRFFVFSLPGSDGAAGKAKPSAAAAALPAPPGGASS